MKRQGITLLSGILAVGCLSGAYYMLKSGNEKAKEKEEQDALGETIVTVDSGEIEGLSFQTEEGTVSFVLGEDGEWRLQGDETFPVDAQALLAPLEQAAPLRAVRTLTDAAELSEYGLDEPQNVITLTEKDGTQTTLTIGARNSSTGNDYLMLNEDSSVIYTVDAAFGSGFSDQLYEYAESEALPMISAADVTEISVERSEDSYSLYLEDALWKTDTSDSADAEAVNDALAKLSGISYSGYFEHDCKELAVYGLDTPSAVLTIKWKEETEAETAAQESGEETEEETAAAEDETKAQEESTQNTEEKRLILRIGDRNEDGGYYVQQDGSGEVHAISADILDLLLNKKSTDWAAAESES